MKIFKNNPMTFVIGPLLDSSGDLITNLATAEEIIFVIKENKTDDDGESLLFFDKSSGNIVVDTPSIGCITITADIDDVSSIAVGKYYKSLQIDKTEVILTENGKVDDRITITQDIIRGTV
jgi:hypothetical protein